MKLTEQLGDILRKVPVKFQGVSCPTIRDMDIFLKSSISSIQLQSIDSMLFYKPCIQYQMSSVHPPEVVIL